MARGFSKVILVGNLTRDPELRATGGGKQVCSFSVAVNRGNSRDDAGSVSYFDCTAWERTAEVISQYAHKGSGVLVSGRLEQRSWEDKEGQKRSRVEIVVEEFQFIGGGNGGGEGGSSAGRSSAKSAPADDVVPEDIGDDPIDLSEIPF